MKYHRNYFSRSLAALSPFPTALFSVFPGMPLLLVTRDQGSVRPHHLPLQLPGGPSHQGQCESDEFIEAANNTPSEHPFSSALDVVVFSSLLDVPAT